MAFNFLKKDEKNNSEIENNTENNIVSNDIYNDYIEKEESSEPVENNITNQGTYHEKEYKSGFLDSHTKVTVASKMSRMLLVLFYVGVVVIAVIVVFMFLTDKYQFYFKKDKIVIGQGSSYQIELTPKNAGSFDYLNYSYSVADTNVATVDEYGTVKAVGKGTTDLKVKMKYGLVSKKMTITTEDIDIDGIVLKVQEEDKMVADSNYDMSVNDTITLHAFAEGREDMNLTVNYESDDTDVAVVDEFGNVTAKGPGTATITGSRDGISSSIDVNVGSQESSDSGNSGSNNSGSNDKVIQSISFAQKDISIKEGGSLTLSINIQPSSLSNSKLTWSSSNSNVSVDSNGRITANSIGDAIITAKSSNGKTAKCTVRVTNETISVNKISLNNSKLSLKKGNSYQLVAKISPSNATERGLTWSSSDTSIVSVNSNGLIKGLKKGTAVITVKSSNGVSSKCTVTVTDTSSASTQLTSVNIGIVQTTKYVGESLQLNAKLTPSNAKVNSITWSSSDNNVATVSSKGLVTMKKAGTVTITVSVNGIKSSGTIIVKKKAETGTTKTPTPTPKPTPVAADKNFTVSKTSLSINKGKTATFDISVIGAAGIIKVTSKDAKIASVKDDDLLWFDGVDNKGNDKTDKQTVTINGVKVGTTTITVKAEDLSSYSTLKSINKTYTITVTVK